MTLLYNYLPVTHEYLNQSEATLDPKENKPIVPAYATLQKPPATNANQVAVFNEAQDQWEIKQDYRGQAYWLADGSEKTIDQIGETLPASGLTDKPVDLKKHEAITAINAGYTAAINSLLEGYPSYLVDTFFKQEQEALAWTLDQTAATPFIDNMIAARGITKADAVDRITQNAATFSAATGQLTGKQQRLTDAINAIPADATSAEADQIINNNQWLDD